MKANTPKGTTVPDASVVSEGARQTNQNGITATITLPVSNPYGIVTFDDLLSEIGRRFNDEKRLKNAAFAFIAANGLRDKFGEYLHDEAANGGATLAERIEMHSKHQSC